LSLFIYICASLVEHRIDQVVILQVHISHLLVRLLAEDMLFEIDFAGHCLESLPQALIVRFGHKIAAMAF
jgi:hypothetical protein